MSVVEPLADCVTLKTRPQSGHVIVLGSTAKESFAHVGRVRGIPDNASCTIPVLGETFFPLITSLVAEVRARAAAQGRLGGSGHAGFGRNAYRLARQGAGTGRGA